MNPPIGERVRALRNSRKYSLSEFAKRTGLFVSYISQLELGYMTPTLDTLDKIASALEIPLYQLFYERGVPPADVLYALRQQAQPPLNRKEIAYMKQLCKYLTRIPAGERKFILFLASYLGGHRRQNISSRSCSAAPKKHASGKSSSLHYSNTTVPDSELNASGLRQSPARALKVRDDSERR